MPTEWVEGTVVHIHKNKGDITECSTYRPICLTQIIYKIWSQLIAQKLIKILHLITKNTQFGHKTHLSTIDAITKIESHLTQATPDTQLLLMGLTKAFDKVNRTIMWTTLYKKGIPIEMITHIRRGHLDTMLLPKTKRIYGKPTENNIGVFQGSAISALLFIIYQDDMMQDYEALNYKRKSHLNTR